MGFQFVIDRKYQVTVEDPPGLSVIFLVNDELGLRFPVAMYEDECANLQTALEEGVGATPPEIASFVREIQRENLRVSKIRILDYDLEENDFLTLVFIEGAENQVLVRRSDIVEALMLSVHSGESIFVEDSTLAHQAESGVYDSVFEALDKFQESGGDNSETMY